MITVTLNSVNINTGNTTIRTIRHDSDAPVQLNALQATREDGEIFISVHKLSKEITIEGTIKGSSQANFESNLDTFKDNINVSGSNLDIEYAGATRRYNVYLKNFSIIRKGHNVSFAIYSATFINSDGYGADTAITETVSATAIADTTTSWNVNYLGSSNPYPQATFIIDTAGNLSRISYKSQQTGEQLDFATAWSIGDQVIIDSLQRTVKRNGSDIDFSGEFPKFAAGTDKIILYLTPTGGLDQEQALSSSEIELGNNVLAAQSFKVSSTTIYLKISLYIKKYSTTTQDLILEIRTDNAGAPSTTVVTNASKTIPASDILTLYSWVDFDFGWGTTPTLNANTTYWIVLRSPSMVDPYIWRFKATNVYANGNRSVSFNNGVSWSPSSNYDFTFRVYKAISALYSIDFKQTYIKKYL